VRKLNCKNRKAEKNQVLWIDHFFKGRFLFALIDFFHKRKRDKESYFHDEIKSSMFKKIELIVFNLSNSRIILPRTLSGYFAYFKTNHKMKWKNPSVILITFMQALYESTTASWSLPWFRFINQKHCLLKDQFMFTKITLCKYKQMFKVYII
jgi:hypothetical protein